jgi:ABC-2 type transport system permease protein
VLEILGNPDWGPILALYVGLFFLGTMTNSMGLLASTLSRNQLVAAVLAICGILFFFTLQLGGLLFADDPDIQRLVHYVSFNMHFREEYTRGLIDVRYLGFYLSFMAFFLFWSVRILEARKWR